MLPSLSKAKSKQRQKPAGVCPPLPKPAQTLTFSRGFRACWWQSQVRPASQMKKIREKISVSLAYRLTPIISGHEAAHIAHIIIDHHGVPCTQRSAMHTVSQSVSQSLQLINQVNSQ